MNLIIGIIASAVIFFQLQYFFAGFIWATGHGAGSFLDFWPIMTPLAILWGGWILLKHKARKYRTLFSLGFSILVIIVVEILMPITPLKVYLQQQTINTNNTQNYYDNLASECKSKESESCCLASVETMKAGNYSLTPQEGCPAGYQLNKMRCIDSLQWCQPVEKSTNAQTQSAPFSLHFFTGGSIFGSSFEVKISGTNITYRESSQGVNKEIQKIERTLLPAELADIQKIVADAKLTSLQSQDFTKDPLVPDQASYRISISLNEKQNTIHCGIPYSDTQPSTNCQKQIDKLRLILNSILGVNIY
jgi:hypothetical protein